MEIEGSRLAERVAEAADAWLRDPTDTGIYIRLVNAVAAWRDQAHPMLEGTDLLALRPGQFPHGRHDDQLDLAAAEPQRLGSVLEQVNATLAQQRSDVPPAPEVDARQD